MVRIISPTRISGVTPTQQEPPGWFTSTMPANGSVGRALGSGCGMVPDELLTRTRPLTPSTCRKTCTSTVSVSSKPLEEIKSREGKLIICTGATGGSFTTVPGGSVATWGTVVTVTHAHQPKTCVMALLPAVRVDRCWDAFSVDSSDTPQR